MYSKEKTAKQSTSFHIFYPLIFFLSKYSDQNRFGQKLKDHKNVKTEPGSYTEVNSGHNVSL